MNKLEQARTQIDAIDREMAKLYEARLDAVKDVDDEISMEWARIPHFYMNFYVYQYATGFSAAMALSQKLLHGTQADVEAYLSFLKSGCTKSPVELLRMAGVDMASPKPVEDAIELFDSLIDEFESIMK